MNSGSFVYIWQYIIDLNFKTEFLTAYRADGDWVQLFSRDANYIKTELLQNSNHKDQYVTVDYWTSKSARDLFRVKYSQEFEELDKRCEIYTKIELFIGDYVIFESNTT